MKADPVFDCPRCSWKKFDSLNDIVEDRDPTSIDYIGSSIVQTYRTGNVEDVYIIDSLTGFSLKKSYTLTPTSN